MIALLRATVRQLIHTPMVTNNKQKSQCSNKLKAIHTIGMKNKKIINDSCIFQGSHSGGSLDYELVSVSAVLFFMLFERS